MGAELTRKQFDILELLTRETGSVTQRQMESISGYSLGTVNSTVKDLSNLGYMKDGKITDDGLLALEPYRAKRAVFIAAGFGTRLVPITLNTPKPLVRVNGERIIDSQIDACLEAGITEIYIVRGYLAEQFDQLLYKYPMVKFLENPVYNEANNISSAMVARYRMQNAYIFEADLLIRNKSLIRKYAYRSNVLGIRKERTDDWCLTEKNGCVDEEKVGGLNCYQLVGIYYFNASDGARLSGDLKQAYENPGGKELFWDNVPNQVFHGKYRIEIRPCNERDVTEIDTFNELKEIDKSYKI